MGSNLCRKIHLLGITYPVVGKQFQVPKIHQGTERIQDLSFEEKARYGLVFVLCKILGRKTPFLYYVRDKGCN